MTCLYDGRAGAPGSVAQCQGGVTEHSLVRQLVDNPAAPPELTSLTGYVGRASTGDYHRIYLDADLSTWIEVRKDDVKLVSVPVPSAPLNAPSLIWLRADAQVRPKPDMPLGEYFAGERRCSQFRVHHPIGRPRNDRDVRIATNEEGPPPEGCTGGVYPCGM
jgi:hypothetical protein